MARRAGRRQEALSKGLIRYFTGKPCLRGHVAERFSKCGRCIECCRRHYYGDQPEKHNRLVRRWQRKHPHYSAEIQAWMKAKELNRIPAWIDESMRQKIRTVYQKADETERRSGIPLEVDHIIPFHGTGVWGLHVPWNLQIITRTQNRSKRNKIEGRVTAWL